MTAYGRSQIAERVDWNVWLAHGNAASPGGEPRSSSRISTNDYRGLLELAAEGFEVALGWDHLLQPWVARDRLQRVGETELVFENALHYLATLKHRANHEAVEPLARWLFDQLAR